MIKIIKRSRLKRTILRRLKLSRPTNITLPLLFIVYYARHLLSQCFKVYPNDFERNDVCTRSNIHSPSKVAPGQLVNIILIFVAQYVLTIAVKYHASFVIYVYTRVLSTFRKITRCFKKNDDKSRRFECHVNTFNIELDNAACEAKTENSYD